MRVQSEQLLQRGADVPRAVLPAVFNIFKLWHLTGTQQMALLGLTAKKTLYNWKKDPATAKLSLDALARISHILGVFKSLEVLFPDPKHADKWLATPNDNPLFNGTRPLDRMLAGQIVDLAAVHDLLDAQQRDRRLVNDADRLPGSRLDGR